MRPLRVVDACSGLGGVPGNPGGWGNTARERGHDVCTIDLDAKFSPDIVADIREVTAADLPWRPDVVLASPPCEGFSVGAIGKNWNHDHTPKHDRARLGIDILEGLLRFLVDCDPTYFVIENPDGKMKRMGQLAHLELRTITFCRYGDIVQKRTTLWGGFPPSLRFDPVCDTALRPLTYQDDAGQRWVGPAGKEAYDAGEHEGMMWVVDRTTDLPCHEAAWRGAKTGTQGKRNAAERALIPRPLADAVLDAGEQDFAADRKPEPLAVLF